VSLSSTNGKECEIKRLEATKHLCSFALSSVYEILNLSSFGGSKSIGKYAAILSNASLTKGFINSPSPLLYSTSTK
jgi:hypothetical protein